MCDTAVHNKKKKNKKDTLISILYTYRDKLLLLLLISLLKEFDNTRKESTDQEF